MTEKTKKPARADEAAQTDAAERAFKPAGIVVAITAQAGPRRRAGLTFGPVATPVPLDELDQEQWEAILADPQLTVRPTKDVGAEDRATA